MSGSSSPTRPSAVVVINGFGDYAKGQMITDKAAIEEIYSEGRSHSVVPIHADLAAWKPRAADDHEREG